MTKVRQNEDETWSIHDGISDSYHGSYITKGYAELAYFLLDKYNYSFDDVVKETAKYGIWITILNYVEDRHKNKSYFKKDWYAQVRLERGEDENWHTYRLGEGDTCTEALINATLSMLENITDIKSNAMKNEGRSTDELFSSFL